MKRVGSIALCLFISCSSAAFAQQAESLDRKPMHGHFNWGWDRPVDRCPWTELLIKDSNGNLSLGLDLVPAPLFKLLSGGSDTYVYSQSYLSHAEILLERYMEKKNISAPNYSLREH